MGENSAVAMADSPLQVGLGGLLAAQNLADPYPMFRNLREAGPLHLEEFGLWVLSDHATCSAVLRDPRFSADFELRTRRFRQLAEMASDTIGDLSGLQEGMRNTLFFMDPPDHTRLRALVSKAFTPRVVEELRGRVQALIDELLNAVEPRGEMDLIADFAYPLPVTVVAEMLGVPVKDRDDFRHRSRDLASILEPVRPPELIRRANVAGEWFAEYFAVLVEERRRKPREDLLSALVAVEDGGETLSVEELITTATLLLLAGHETTQNLVGNGLLALLRRPDQLGRLREDPSLGRTAVEELLRFDGPVTLTSRVATADVDTGQVPFKADDQVLTLLGAANHDPLQFTDPDELDIGRADNHHLAFAAGAHFCLGAPLARLEGQLAFETLLRRFPELALSVDEPEWRDSVTLRGLKSLPLRLQG
jgi:cytochrome P450